MIPFYQFQNVYVRELSPDSNKDFDRWEPIPSPTCNVHKMRRRIGPLHHFVSHNKRDEPIIWGFEIAVHASLIERFEREGFTGFRTQPAFVTFRDGATSDEYCEFNITGWAGVVRQESGMRMIASCPDCKWKNYGPITDFDQVIDWEQWTEEDFFVVWPLVGQRLCAERVANFLKSSGIKNLRIGLGFSLLQERPNSLHFGIPRGALSEYLPKDLAIKYGEPLGLE
jgi:hypothetical protein